MKRHQRATGGQARGQLALLLPPPLRLPLPLMIIRHRKRAATRASEWEEPKSVLASAPLLAWPVKLDLRLNLAATEEAQTNTQIRIQQKQQQQQLQYTTTRAACTDCNRHGTKPATTDEMKTTKRKPLPQSQANMGAFQAVLGAREGGQAEAGSGIIGRELRSQSQLSASLGGRRRRPLSLLHLLLLLLLLLVVAIPLPSVALAQAAQAAPTWTTSARLALAAAAPSPSSPALLRLAAPAPPAGEYLSLVPNLRECRSL